MTLLSSQSLSAESMGKQRNGWKLSRSRGRKCIVDVFGEGEEETGEKGMDGNGNSVAYHGHCNGKGE